MSSLANLHPMIVHFPIALLLVAPLLVVLGLALARYRAGLHLAALTLLVLGSSGAVLAVLTGMAASGMIHGTPDLTATLARHEQLAKQTAICYAVLTLGFLLLQAWSLPRPSLTRTRGWLALNVAWLLVDLAAALLLARTGQLGGRMVHELGIRSGLVRQGFASGEPRGGGHRLSCIHHQHPSG